jgi:hypothetical protein
MKGLIYVGLVVLILGIASLVVPIPHTDRAGIEIGNVNLGVQTHHDDKVSPGLSAALILGGVGLMIAGNFGGSRT